MMKKVAFLSATVAMLVLSGCSSKEPAIDASANANASAGTKANGSDANSVISPVSNANVTDANGANGANGSDGGLVSILFDYDKFDIRADMQDAMAKNALLVKGKTIKLEGNCDEFGSDEYNFALGLKRANSVKAALVNSGISADSIAMSSLGESNPVCLEKSKDCWQKNRRVDFKLP
ncbi:OmpA/MotB domain protein [Sulfuricurvum kujiense DSM 16994]|uniref:OmpA/MotB domain protein n=1 Tax=Sulfuricurvum kujiense (strain ATCC BAA-921 / DSM 16994 / JCM 11577 / YK-1) TaxID=709032 RepID=E4U1J5_SULKY|nr:OmpA family protein [Sulfuricurvum kujiense]ADR33431.1 OmpA/MotB domain protein [Sulfuricurvum kujiense DSM 16994]